jgi:shikimate kinase
VTIIVIKPNLILTGFMGAGKTTVGYILAGQLKMPFVDTDLVLTVRMEQTIPALFARRGEPAFRRLEATVCAQVAAKGGQVIATGGGAVVNPATRALLERSGLLVCLTADLDTLMARLDGSQDRPLAGDRARMAALLAERQPIYSSLPCRVDTTGKTPGQVANEVIALWRSAH